MQIINGKQLSQKIRTDIKQQVDAMTAAGQRPPHLAVVLVGDDPASQTYVAAKARACTECGIRGSVHHLPATTTQRELLDLVNALNNDSDVDGFIVQLPLPDHIDTGAVIAAIDPDKDVDGFTPVNIGRLVLGLDAFLPATPAGILQILDHYNIDTQGKHCVVVGRSNIVGKPLANLLMQKSQRGAGATVTVCHTATPDLASHTRRADILITAAGHPGLITADMVKPGSVVIDVGIARVPDSTKKSGSRLCGDVDFDAVAPLCSFITPVPGGVGPMTIASLLTNTMKARQARM